MDPNLIYLLLYYQNKNASFKQTNTENNHRNTNDKQQFSGRLVYEAK